MHLLEIEFESTSSASRDWQGAGRNSLTNGFSHSFTAAERDMKIGTKNWNQSLPEVLDEVMGLFGMLSLVAVAAIGFAIVHALSPR